MLDSLGDGWNGNVLSIVDSSGNILLSTTLNSGFSATDSICLTDDCFTITCDGGASQSEVSWNFTDHNGTVLFSGGAPYIDTICMPYSCTPQIESFENITSPWTPGIYTGFGQTSNLPWLRHSGTTPTQNTGPSSAYDGNWYMYMECAAFPVGSDAILTANCISTSDFNNLHLSFYYHMYGASMGSLNVEVSSDGGNSWVTEWTKSGNQSDQWWHAYVDLSSYTSNIMVRFKGEVGIYNTGDIAIDLVSFEDPISGCMDPYADNFDSLAVIDNASCTYVNCSYFTLNMYDTFGDGWNGNYFTITSSTGVQVFTTTLESAPNGYFGTTSFCIPSDCYSIVCDGGQWQYEVSWDLIDIHGNIVLSDGAPYVGNICLPLVYGCMDPLATNYDSTVTFSDGSCLYPPLSFSGVSSDISCNGLSDGSITLSVSGGDAPYSYLWSNGATTKNINSLSANTYSVVVTDIDGDTASAAFTVYEPDTLLVDFVIIDASGVGINDGAIYSFVSGGVLPYEYFWLSSFINDTTPNIVNVPAGSYTSYILDDNGCFNFVSLTVGVDSTTNGCTDPLAFNYDPNALFDDGSCIYVGCTDPNADNYNSLATIDDGSCYYCNAPNTSPNMLYANWTTDTKAEINWNNMNDECNMVWKYYIRYRELGSNTWITKSAGVGNGLCNSGLNTTTKTLQNLLPATTYEYKMKAFYCGGSASTYSLPEQFTTKGDCPAMAYLNVSTFNTNHSKARFNWNSFSPYVFARVILRVDVPGSNWLTAGGFGIYYPTLNVNKFGLTAGESYRAQGRLFCDSNITSYRSTWTSPVYWTQPGSIKINGGSTINNLDVYPNPSRDIYNISFSSDEIQNVTIRITNMVGADVYLEDKKQFIGEYTKQISLGEFGKGIYVLKIETENGITNKKLILQ